MHTVELEFLALHAGNPGPMTGAGNWTYLVRGTRPVLIDAGTGVPCHLDAIVAAAPTGPARVVVTHGHTDHASGAAALARRCPSARFSKLPWPERDREFAVSWEPLVDGQTIESESGPLEVVHTPGHAPDHVALWHASSRTIFTGDLLVLGGTVVVPASRGGRLRDYLDSLERVAALHPARALPAHGPAVDDPLALIAAYLAHRTAREGQILDALKAGDTTTERMAARIYVGLAPALVPMAQESVLAHLVKLQDDGRVVIGPAGWTLVS